MVLNNQSCCTTYRSRYQPSHEQHDPGNPASGLLELAHHLVRAGSLAHAGQILSYAQAAGDIKGLAQALMQKTLMDITIGAVPYGMLVNLELLQDVFEHIDDDEPSLRGRITVVMAQAYQYARQSSQAKSMIEHALDLGHRAEDAHLCAEASHALAQHRASEMAVEESIGIWKQSLDYAKQTEDLVIQSCHSSIYL